MGDVVVVPLGRKHRPMLAGFQNAHDSLVVYLRRWALRHAEKDLLSRTHLAIAHEEKKRELVGYFSLAADAVERGSVADLPELNRLPGFPVPAVLLARLAVDTRAQGQGLGRFLFEHALGMAIEFSRAGPVAFRVLVTDAIDASAVRFYDHFGMVRISDGYPARMVLDLAPLVRAAKNG